MHGADVLLGALILVGLISIAGAVLRVIDPLDAYDD